MMSASRQSLYQRLPEIYHIKDEEQVPAGQLEAWLDILDQTQAALHDNIEWQYTWKDDIIIQDKDII